jgi:hypothetical protein
MPVRIAEEKERSLLQKEAIIGNLDYAKTGNLGLLDSTTSKKILNMLVRSRWKQHFAESSDIYWYRTIGQFANGDPSKWHKIINK